MTRWAQHEVLIASLTPHAEAGEFHAPQRLFLIDIVVHIHDEGIVKAQSWHRRPPGVAYESRPWG
jgi:hypothetical protein